MNKHEIIEWLLLCVIVVFAISYGMALSKPFTNTKPMGTYFECAYPYMGGGIYLPCTQKQRERDV